MPGTIRHLPVYLRSLQSQITPRVCSKSDRSSTNHRDDDIMTQKDLQNKLSIQNNRRRGNIGSERQNVKGQETDSV
ncbi:hypothetical protein JZ751_012698 [Albula glossodonta]|uniref:Uncharacterized protein n=1 Tax=Albula glossodonta TaxID=121402 RepID=A0A8T2MYJ5_9TELE|nr:hypothetical protein JZ751_012698 [Albula glossodonta]